MNKINVQQAFQQMFGDDSNNNDKMKTEWRMDKVLMFVTLYAYMYAYM